MHLIQYYFSSFYFKTRVLSQENPYFSPYNGLQWGPTVSWLPFEAALKLSFGP